MRSVRLSCAVDLADAALGHAEDLADLAQGEVLDVEQHGDLALAARELRERARGSGPSRSLRGGGVLGIEALVLETSVSMRSMVVSSSHSTSVLSDVTSEDDDLVAGGGAARRTVMPSASAQLLARRLAAVEDRELLASPC